MLKIILPYPPSVNHYWRHVGSKILISREGRAFRELVVGLMVEQRVKPLAGPLAIDINIHPPDHRRRDVDNVLKSLLDALEHGHAYYDDGQITKLHIEKLAPMKPGRAVVSLRQIEGTQ